MSCRYLAIQSGPRILCQGGGGAAHSWEVCLWETSQLRSVCGHHPARPEQGQAALKKWGGVWVGGGGVGGRVCVCVVVGGWGGVGGPGHSASAPSLPLAPSPVNEVLPLLGPLAASAAPEGTLPIIQRAGCKQ